MKNYRTKQGDRLDKICQREYGATSGVVEKVLAANPGLASLGAELPFGIVIQLPTFETKTTSTIVRLWT